MKEKPETVTPSVSGEPFMLLHSPSTSTRKTEKERPAFLKVHDLGKTFHVNGALLNVLDNICFEARDGELVCIVGRSGCGKSTLLKILAGFIPPTSGSVRINGRTVRTPGPDRCVVFQEDALFPWLTVGENIAFGLKGRLPGRKAVDRETDRMLSLVGLASFKAYLPREISGGMKQRVALARVLVLQPRILLMDEPFAALDAQTREEMQTLLLDLHQRFSHTILFVTHDVGEAVALSDRIIVMDKNPGRILEVMDVKLPRPRKREDLDFVSFQRRLYRLLQG